MGKKKVVKKVGKKKVVKQSARKPEKVIKKVLKRPPEVEVVTTPTPEPKKDSGYYSAKRFDRGWQ